MSTAAAVIYTTRPNYEKKGIAELERHGVSAFTAYDETGKRAKVTAPGYIFANRRANAAFLRHVRGKPMGYASLADIANLYVRKDVVVQAPVNVFVCRTEDEPGDKVEIKRGPFAALLGEVIEVCKKGYIVEVEMFGKFSRVSMAPQSMRKIHINPG